jgi:hypothetical protein
MKMHKTFNYPSFFTQIYSMTAPERYYKAPSFDRFLYDEEHQLLTSPSAKAENIKHPA